MLINIQILSNEGSAHLEDPVHSVNCEEREREREYVYDEGRDNSINKSQKKNRTLKQMQSTLWDHHSIMQILLSF